MKFIGIATLASGLLLLNSCSVLEQVYPSQLSQVADTVSNEADAGEEAQDDTPAEEELRLLSDEQQEQEQKQERAGFVRLPIAPRTANAPDAPPAGGRADSPAKPATPDAAKPELPAAPTAPAAPATPAAPAKPDTAPAAETKQPDLPRPSEKKSKEEEPDDIMPSPEQIKAALKMLREQAAKSPKIEILNPATAPRPQPAAPAAAAPAPQRQAASASRSAPLRLAEPSFPRADTPEERPAQPLQDAAQQHGLRAPSLPKLLPMDIDGKIHTTGHP